MSGIRLIAKTEPCLEAIPDSEGLLSFCARVSNKNNQYNFKTASSLIRYCIKNKHWSVFEQVNLTFEINTVRAISAQILRHTSLKPQELCIGGDSSIKVWNEGSKRSREVSIEDLYRLYFKGHWMQYRPTVRVYDEHLQRFTSCSIREVFSTGIKPLFKMTLSDGKSIEATADHKFMVKGGFVKLGDLREGHFIAVNGKPVSLYPELAFEYSNLQLLTKEEHLEKSKKESHSVYTASYKRIESIEFIGEKPTYDMEVEHTSHNYVANGIVTHNSQRYTGASIVYPELRLKGSSDRQGSLDMEASDEAYDKVNALLDKVYELYKQLIDPEEYNVALESARMILPMCSETTMYINGSLRSWLHYCDVRTSIHTQKEHRVIAEYIQKEIFRLYPSVQDGWLDCKLQ